MKQTKEIYQALENLVPGQACSFAFEVASCYLAWAYHHPLHQEEGASAAVVVAAAVAVVDYHLRLLQIYLKKR